MLPALRWWNHGLANRSGRLGANPLRSGCRVRGARPLARPSGRGRSARESRPRDGFSHSSVKLRFGPHDVYTKGSLRPESFMRNHAAGVCSAGRFDTQECRWLPCGTPVTTSKPRQRAGICLHLVIDVRAYQDSRLDTYVPNSQTTPMRHCEVAHSRHVTPCR